MSTTVLVDGWVGPLLRPQQAGSCDGAALLVAGTVIFYFTVMQYRCHNGHVLCCAGITCCPESVQRNDDVLY